MFKKYISLLFGMLLLFAMACFAQPAFSQTVNIAPGASVKLQANSVHATSYQWIKDGTAIAGATSSFYIASSAGTYTVISSNEGGCASEISDPVIITMSQAAAFADMMVTKTAELRAITLDDTFEYNLMATNNGPDVANSVKVTDLLPAGLSYEQIISPALGSAQYSESTRTVTWNILKMASGETANLKIKVKATKPGPIMNMASVSALETDPKLNNNTSIHVKSIVGVDIPNVFTPNNDGKNDSFTIRGIELYETNTLTILNRWGSTVYEKNGYTNDWTANGLSDGTYFYILKVKITSAAWQEFKGYVTVMR